MARRRGLTEDEKQLWSRVARSAVPLHGSGKPACPDSFADPAKTSSPRPVKVPAVTPPMAMPSPDPGRSRPLRPATSYHPPQSPAEHLAAAPVRMDHKTHKRLKQGRLRPESRLDLHGMTLAVAQPELAQFILSCHAAGLRLVLVITGKGRSGDHGPLPTRPGALRHQVPHWLHMPPLSAVVQQVTAAHVRHGGEGAYYVYLRRRNCIV